MHVILGRLNIAVDVVGDELLTGLHWSLLLILHLVELSKEDFDLLLLQFVSLLTFLELSIQIIDLSNQDSFWWIELRVVLDLATIGHPLNFKDVRLLWYWHVFEVFSHIEHALSPFLILKGEIELLIQL